MFQNASGTSSAGRMYSPGSMVVTMPGCRMRLGRSSTVLPLSGSTRSTAWSTSEGST